MIGTNQCNKGLRVNGKAAELWLAYFAMELAYVDKISRRHQLLFGDDGGNADDGGVDDYDEILGQTAGSEDKKSKSKKKDGRKRKSAEIGGQQDKDGAKEEEEEEKAGGGGGGKKAIDVILSGAIAKIIFDNAIRSVDASHANVAFAHKAFVFLRMRR